MFDTGRIVVSLHPRPKIFHVLPPLSAAASLQCHAGLKFIVQLQWLLNADMLPWRCMCIVQLTKKSRICAIVVKDCCQATTQPGEGDNKFGAKMFLTPSIGSSDLSTYNMWLHLFLRFSKDWKFPLLQSRIISQLFSLGKVLCVSMLLAENILFQDVKICFARCHDVTSCENTRGKQGWCKNRIVRYCANSPRWLMTI